MPRSQTWFLIDVRLIATRPIGCVVPSQKVVYTGSKRPGKCCWQWCLPRGNIWGATLIWEKGWCHGANAVDFWILENLDFLWQCLTHFASLSLPRHCASVVRGIQDDSTIRWMCTNHHLILETISCILQVVSGQLAFIVRGKGDWSLRCRSQLVSAVISGWVESTVVILGHWCLHDVWSCSSLRASGLTQEQCADNARSAKTWSDSWHLGRKKDKSLETELLKVNPPLRVVSTVERFQQSLTSPSRTENAPVS